MAAVQGGQPSQKDNKNQVAQPPLVVSVIDESGKISKPWAIWFRAIYNRIGYKGEENLNAIDENVNEIDGVVDTIEEVVIVLEDHEVRIATNTDNIATNTDNIATNADDISSNALAIIANTDYIDLTREQAKAAFVAAGYGSIGVGAVKAIGTINSTFKTLDGFDTDLIATPLDVTYDKANHGLKLDRQGLWEFTIKVALTFDDANSGRQIQFRSYNATTATPGNLSFNYFVGRNQDGANIPLTISIDIPPANVGDLIQLQVGSASDTFTNSSNIGTIYQVKHISERKEDLGA